MNINIRQMEALEHVKKKGEDTPSNKLVLILVNKKTGVATECFLTAQRAWYWLKSQALK